MPRTLSATTDPAPITATEASILWTECLHGAGNLRSAMDAIAQASQASSIVLIRACLQTNKVRILSSFDRDAARGAQPMPQPLGLDLITVPPQSARLGSVWSL